MLRERRQARERQFDELFAQSWPRAVSSARRIVGDTAIAEEIAQEAFTRAYDRWSSVSGHPSPAGWVLRTAINLAIDHVRRKRPVLTAEPVADRAMTVLDRLVLEDALNALPAKQRHAITLRYLAGFTEPEIAAALNVAPGTVKTHLSRGLSRLRDELGVELDVMPA